MTRRADYFARVRPLLGDGLSRKTIAVENLSACGRLLEMLAACMLRRVVVRDPAERIAWPLVAACRSATPPAAGMTALAYMQTHLRWKNRYRGVRWLRRGVVDLTVRAELVEPGASPSLTWSEAERTVTLHVVRGDERSYLDLANLAAREVRDVLLGRMPWPSGTRYLGSRDWPFAVSARPLSPPPQRASDLAGLHIMVVGVGSVGSELVRSLATSGARWTLVDPGKVSIFNPHRQWFGTADVGRRKVTVLAERLTRLAEPVAAAGSPVPERASRSVEARPLVRAVTTRFCHENLGELGELLVADRPDAVVLTTGTSEDAALAEVFWRHRIPYLAAYAYPQARYFEVTVASPRDLTPCLHCFRGHLYKGVEAAPPMTDEVASFLYREPSAAARDRLYVNLVAEPATPLETSRIADVSARLLTELVGPLGARSSWFARMLAEGTTCLLGANVVERRDGEPVYGMTYAGQVVRLGLGDLVGAEAQRVCGVCGRELQTTHRLELPRAADADVDAALTG